MVALILVFLASVHILSSRISVQRLDFSPFIQISFLEYTFQDATIKKLCNDFVRQFCHDYVNEAMLPFQLSVMACAMVITGLVLCLMSISAMSARGGYNNAHEDVSNVQR